MSGKLRKRAAGALVALAVGTSGGVLATSEPAAASAYNCYAGLVNATKAWGQCRNASGGWGGFKLTVNCYFYPQQTSYGQAPQTIWASCPSWSHVTGIYITPASF
jgi:hypothetical protein